MDFYLQLHKCSLFSIRATANHNEYAKITAVMAIIFEFLIYSKHINHIT